VERKREDAKLANSLMRIAKERVKFFSSKEISVFTLEGIYEAILELCHALLALNGVKTVSHECAIEFLRENEVMKSSDIEFVHQLRKRRHSIKYYGVAIGSDVLVRYVERATKIFNELVDKLEKELFSNELKERITENNLEGQNTSNSSY